MSKTVIALAGNPNVGKSTVFNSLTGMRQHTGNWPGKTVSAAEGRFCWNGREYLLMDLPGCYSLVARSAEEETARDYICSGAAALTIVVCDATCLERSLNLVLQTMEITDRVLVCVNLMDEAERRGISIDIDLLSRRLGVPAVGITARDKKSAAALPAHIESALTSENAPLRPKYPEYIQDGAKALLSLLPPGAVHPEYTALRLLDGTLSAPREAAEAAAPLRGGRGPEAVSDDMAAALISSAEEACRGVVCQEKPARPADRHIDRVLTSRAFGFPIMLLLLGAVFWITIAGANCPSALLSSAFLKMQDKMMALCRTSSLPPWLYEMLILGMFRVVSWVVAVMLPPMAIFFPLFTLLEDLGYLPRVAFNLDKCFKGCRACGKQALTMAMGFGCNAVGVTGCRIIDSPRERLIAVITNSFVPCNGRFPTLIAIISIFFVSGAGTLGASVKSAAILTAVILFGVLMTLAASRLLSATLLRGTPSAFTLELPPYRPPQVGKVIIRSVLDRTVFVLGRAVAAAMPAGFIIWLMANVTIDGVTVLSRFAGFLDPFARLMGLDGIILTAFILGFPANEIVIPIMLMGYMAQGALIDYESLSELRGLLLQNGWSWTTAVSMLLFSLMHWPCATTCITIRKETQSLKWTLVSILTPAFMGAALCILFNAGVRLIL